MNTICFSSRKSFFKTDLMSVLLVMILAGCSSQTTPSASESSGQENGYVAATVATERNLADQKYQDEGACNYFEGEASQTFNDETGSPIELDSPLECWGGSGFHAMRYRIVADRGNWDIASEITQHTSLKYSNGEVLVPTGENSEIPKDLADEFPVAESYEQWQSDGTVADLGDDSALLTRSGVNGRGEFHSALVIWNQDVVRTLYVTDESSLDEVKDVAIEAAKNIHARELAIANDEVDLNAEAAETEQPKDPLRAYGTVSYEDEQGYTFDIEVSWQGHLPRTEVGSNPPGLTSIIFEMDPVDGSFTNTTTGGRELPGNHIGTTFLVGLYPSDSKVCPSNKAEGLYERKGVGIAALMDSEAPIGDGFCAIRFALSSGITFSSNLSRGNTIANGVPIEYTGDDLEQTSIYPSGLISWERIDEDEAVDLAAILANPIAIGVDGGDFTPVSGVSCDYKVYSPGFNFTKDDTRHILILGTPPAEPIPGCKEIS